MTNDRDEAIKARAYQLWVEGGYAHGHDKEHWQQAKRELSEAVETENVTDIGQRHDDRVSKLPAQDDESTILHRVPKPGPKHEQ